MFGLDLERMSEPVVDADAMIAPGLIRVGARLEAIVLKAFAVFGKRDAARVVVRKARAVQSLVSPPNLSRVEAGIGDGARW